MLEKPLFSSGHTCVTASTCYEKKSCAMLCLVLVCCVSPVVGQTEVSNSWKAQYHEGLQAYRNACLEPANDEIVLTFDSLALVLLAQEPTSAMAAGMRATAQLMLAESMWNPLDKLTQFQSCRSKQCRPEVFSPFRAVQRPCIARIPIQHGGRRTKHTSSHCHWTMVHGHRTSNFHLLISRSTLT